MRTIGIRASFADALLWTRVGGGGPFEIEAGGLCTTPEAAESVTKKIEIAIALHDTEGSIPDIVLELTHEESLCLAVASQNCGTNDLPAGQRTKLDEWFEEWRRSKFNLNGSWEEAAS